MDHFISMLQLFAEDGSAATTGVTDADAGHQQLLALGVPADKLRKNRAYAVSAPAETQAQDAAAQKDTAPAMSWEEICQHPEYQEKMQKMVQSRVKNVQQAQQDLSTLLPALQVMANTYGLDPERLDYAALAQAIRADDRLYHQQGQRLGVSGELARRLDRMEQTQREQSLKTHFEKLRQQSEHLKAQVPDFDLAREMENPSFLRLTAPNVGLSVEDAYFALHRRQLQDQTALQISNAIRSGAMRPEENGMASHGPAVTSFDYRNASREQRAALKQAIRAAGARGEKIYPGGWNG